MNGVYMKLLATSVSAFLLLIATTASAGKITKTFPDVEEHLEMFLKFPLGMTQRKFRARVPEAWRLAPTQPGFMQNHNSWGEVNSGWFSYTFVARGTWYPVTRFYFWEGKLIYSELESKTNAKTESQAHYDAGPRAAAWFDARYSNGRRFEEKSFFSAIWQSGGKEDDVRAEIVTGVKPEFMGSKPLASLMLVHRDLKGFEAWEGFLRRGPAGAGTGPVATIYCNGPDDGDDSISEDFLSMIDARALTEDQTHEILKRKLQEFTSHGYTCEGGVADKWPISVEADRRAVKLRQSHTYLYYMDEHGLIVTQEYKNANVNIEDSVCEEHRDQLSPVRRVYAECVTGTAVWQRHAR